MGNNSYYTVIATKVSKADKEKLNIIAKRFNMTVYELLQALLLALLRYFDTFSSVSCDHIVMLNAFFNTIFSLKGSFSPIALTGHLDRTISQAILFVNQKHSKQPQLLAINKDECGNIKESYNFDMMLSDFMKALEPEVLNVITRERDKRGYFSIVHTLHNLVLENAEKSPDTISQEVSSMFTDERIGLFGEKINNDVFYKKKPNCWEECVTAPPPNKTFAVNN